ncbi:Detected protein of unknown function [Hibiscus syriacus]|uniref:Uncharacterized protein n=1 Tax=Hibiscus syriacus TaxID=106335 RepID=A0A6A3BQQ7_HIBSY|nr:uncharacterized protein LOC120211786 [Hibiscus syriacus]KAE8718904.1 Detected protein of unknown function [Hibiscus syriacus]
MGVEVLKPEDCLKIPNPMKHPRNPRHNPNPNNNRTNRRKRSPNASPPSRPRVTLPKSPTKNLVMGQVKILKRGEEIKSSKPDNPVENVDVDLSGEHLKGSKPDKPVENVDVDLGSTLRSDPDLVSVPTQMRAAESENDTDEVVPPFFYAGSAFVTSPPPSSVPLPAFFTKKVGVALKDDVATNVLRGILRLDL